MLAESTNAWLRKERCYTNLQRLVDRAADLHNFVWIDMESSPYVDPTLDLFKRTRAPSALIGIALQAYLYRTVDSAACTRRLLPQQMPAFPVIQASSASTSSLSRPA